MGRPLLIGLLTLALATGCPAQNTPGMPASNKPDYSKMTSPNKEWAVIVGVSEYKKLPKDDWIPGCKKDADAFAAFIKSPRGGAFPSDHVELLLDGSATIQSVRLALDNVVKRHQRGDVIYIFFACHGRVESYGAGEMAYLMMNDSDPEHLSASALPMDELRRHVDSHLRDAQVVMISDACHAGQLVKVAETTRRTNSITDYFNEMGERQGNLNLMACRRDESSIEDVRLDGHGTLTYCLLQALNGANGSTGGSLVRTQDVLDFVSRQVPKLTNQQQHPRYSTSYVDEFPLARLDLAGPNLNLPPFPQDSGVAGLSSNLNSLSGLATLKVGGAPENSELYLVQGSTQRSLGRVLIAGNQLVLDGLSPGEYTLVQTKEGTTSQWPLRLKAGPQMFDTRSGSLDS